jgi:hypothetical protein
MTDDTTEAPSIPAESKEEQGAITSTTAAAAATADDDDVEEKPRREDLIDLIRAIKFAKPDASQSEVHKEITEVLSKKSPEFEFLQNVHIHDVKKVWKKALGGPNNNNNNNNTNAATPNQDLKEQLQSTGQPIQVFTVGNGSVKHLAQEYTAAHVAAQEQLLAEEEKSRREDYVYAFLNVPADKSGSRPHQALIHFPKEAATTTTGGEAASGNGSSSTTTSKATTSSNKKKGSNKKKKGGKAAAAATNTATTTTPPSTIDDKIVKIQMAASDDDDTKYPMLVYNHSRTAKTFLHPADEGYDQIQEWIHTKGVGGTLGARGGTKAYFYATVLSYKGGEGLLQIQVTELAPQQEW